MNKTFQLDIITPTSTFNEGQVEYLRAPSIDGLFGVQANHVSSIITIDVGEVKVVKNGGKELYFSTAGGFADIRPEGVVLLIENLENASDIDIKRAKDAESRARKNLKDTSMDLDRAKLALKRAQNRVRISTRI